MNATQTYIGTLVVVTCIDCGAPFGISDALHRHFRKTGETFYCPSGHSQCYRETDEARYNKQLDQLNAQIIRAKEEALYQRNLRLHTEHSLAATKGVLTKVKRRVAAGICPCCHRQFEDLRRHMGGQHPDFVNP